ncbi:MAG: glutaminyl-peptide cyclotransferase [Fibromonadaceae bacterium]|jgi:glutamine cyclotransferase|nr:glutaminyl-peptide cyclotransferase [Fibromonadaceae bacterium]
MLKSTPNIQHKILVILIIGAQITFAALPVYKIKVIDSIPHSETRFTQGLFWDGDELWESTGLEGKSKIYRMNKKGETFDSLAMPGFHFGEGIAKIGNKMLWLTWRSNIGFVLSQKPLRILGTFPIAGEGWGLSVWQGNWIMSNGSSTLSVLSFRDMKVIKTIDVKAGGVPVSRLNELEVVGDTLYANVWHSDSIAVISLPSGNVVKWLDFSERAKNIRKKHPNAEVLNGTAFDGKNLWITGKNWPWIYRVSYYITPNAR